jgi:cytochrome c biogenesis protein CcmG, thiol:disulfide interchange protein DsbE
MAESTQRSGSHATADIRSGSHATADIQSGPHATANMWSSNPASNRSTNSSAASDPPLAQAAAGEGVVEGVQPSQARFLAWRLFFVGILALFLGLLGWQLYRTNVFEQRADGMAPPIVFTTFENEVIELEALRGKGVVVNFWASWCDPCREEAPLLEATWQREKDNGIVFLGLDYLDQEPAALGFLEEFGITYPNGPDLRSEAARRYGIKGVPETYFIDPEGRIVGTVIGPVVDQAELDDYMDRIRPQS